MLDVVNSHRLRKPHRSAIKTFFILLFLVFTVNSLLKATNDPLVSNRWWFYSIQEKKSVQWMDDHLQEKVIWMGVDSRYISIFDTFSNLDGHRTIKFSFPRDANYWIVSNTIKLRARNIHFRLPDIENRPIVYDSGGVKIYSNE